MNQIVEKTSQQAYLPQPSFWRNVSRDPVSAHLSSQDIPNSERNSYFSAKFSPPDATLQSEHENKLDQFLSSCLINNFVVSIDSVLRATQRLKRKKSSGIDKVSALHVLHGSELLLNHVALLMQMLFWSPQLPKLFPLLNSLNILIKHLPTEIRDSRRLKSLSINKQSSKCNLLTNQLIPGF